MSVLLILMRGILSWVLYAISIFQWIMATFYQICNVVYAMSETCQCSVTRKPHVMCSTKAILTGSE